MCEFRQREYLECGHFRWHATKLCEKFKNHGRSAKCEPQIIEFEETRRICPTCFAEKNWPPHTYLIDPTTPFGRYFYRRPS